jgi:xanthine dehydrogenase YagR molybdenum-binding subunit
MNKDKAGPVVGKPIDRVDGVLKVTGRARYAADYPEPKSSEPAPADVTFAALVQSTISSGKIKSIDSSAAEKSPGVVAVFTYKNSPKIPAKAIEDFDDSLHLLQDNVIHHDRQNIGIVVADSFENATHAASLLKVEYEPGAVVAEMDGEISRAKYPNGKKEDGSKRGNFNAALKQAAVKVDATYVTPTEIHSQMEPHATTAVWKDGKLLVWESTQAIFNTRNKLAKAFGLPADKVRVIANFIGGGFGTKLTTWSNTVLCAMAAKETGRPVKLTCTRANVFSNTGNRPRTVQRVILAANHEGKLLGINHDCINESSRFADFTEDGSRLSAMLYSCPNVITSSKIVSLDIGKPTWMRAPGECPGAFAIECAMDELSYALGIDPIKLRLINYAEKDESENLPWSSKSLKEAYEKGAAHFGWEKRKPQPGSMKNGKLLVGWGMATATHPTHRMKTSAKLEMKQDGGVIVRCGTQDIGTGTYTIMSQVAADTLGVPLSRVRFELGDTLMPEAPLSGGSMTAASAGSAVHDVCKEAIAKLVKLATEDKKSPLFAKPAEDIVARDGGLYLRSNQKEGESYESILKRSSTTVLEASASSAQSGEAAKYSKHSFGAHFVEVQVDPELGTIRGTRFVSAIGAGKILNPKTAASQIKGGVIFGVGMALTEEVLRDHRTGRIMNADLAEYHIPVHADIPDIDIIFVEEKDNIINPLGAKGVGEIANIGVAAAIANAVYHATGKRVRELPITLDRII